ncbi:hypothetical protein BG005_011545 [Podila minutissima]|nr:hypothetical protein BG005_011545 [Podila minutissima]
MSLYGNQSAAPKRDSNGFNMGQQQQQFGQLQGMNSFGFGQAPVQQQQQPQQQQQQNMWGNDDGFGAMQQAGSASSFDAFASGGNSGFGGQSNSNGFGQMQNGFGQSNGFGHNNNSSNNNGVPQGGDFFNMIAGVSRSPQNNSPAQNKNNSAFGDLTWN